MIPHIPSQWPRAFTVIGLGAAAPLTLFGPVVSQIVKSVREEGRVQVEEIRRQNAEILDQIDRLRSLGNQPDVAQIEVELLSLIVSVEDLEASTAALDWNLWVGIDSGISSLGQTQFALLSIASIFIAYIIGEAIIQINRIVWVDREGVKNWAARLAKCVEIDNALLAAAYSKAENSRALYEGLAMLSVSFGLGLCLSISAGASYWYLLAVPISFGLNVLLALTVRSVGAELDMTLNELRYPK